MGNPFRTKAKTTDHIQFWVDETFKEAAEKFEDSPVAAFVMVFTKTKKGNVGSVYKRVFDAPTNPDGLRNKDLVMALEDTSFDMRLDATLRSRGILPKKK